MFKQLLTGGSVLALLLATSFSAQAKPTAPTLQSQVQAPIGSPTSPEQQDSSTTVPGPNSTDDISSPSGSSQTTPASDSSTTTSASPGAGDSDTAFCQSYPVASPTGGGTRQRLQAEQKCNQTDNF